MENSIGLEIPDDLPPIYHLPPQRFYFFNSHDGYWQEATQDTVKAELAGTFGQNPVSSRRGELSQVSRTLLRIKKELRIDGVACLGWEEMGIRILDGKRVLVEKGCSRIEPIPGPWEETRTYLTRLFGPDLPYFLGWMATGARGFYDPAQRRYGQCLILAGPRNAGKSYLQMQIITKVLGGTIGRPYEWLTKQTPFNSELFESVHLLSEDDYHLADPRSRDQLGASIKKVTANVSQEYNKKHGSKLVLRPYWRMSFSLNGETHYLAALPVLDASMMDKLVILECSSNAVHLPTSGPDGNVMERATNSELPAFIHYLLNEHVISPEIADDRYGMMGYANIRIKEELAELGEEYLLLECLQIKYRGADDVRKTLLGIMNDLESPDTAAAIKMIIRRHYTIKGCLEKLALNPESGVKKVSLYRNTKGWSLTFPEKN